MNQYFFPSFRSLFGKIPPSSPFSHSFACKHPRSFRFFRSLSGRNPRLTYFSRSPYHIPLRYFRFFRIPNSTHPRYPSLCRRKSHILPLCLPLSRRRFSGTGVLYPFYGTPSRCFFCPSPFPVRRTGVERYPQKSCAGFPRDGNNVRHIHPAFGIRLHKPPYMFPLYSRHPYAHDKPAGNSFLPPSHFRHGNGIRARYSSRLLPVHHRCVHGKPPSRNNRLPMMHSPYVHGTPSSRNSRRPTTHFPYGHDKPPPRNSLLPMTHFLHGHGKPPSRSSPSHPFHSPYAHDNPLSRNSLHRPFHSPYAHGKPDSCNSPRLHRHPPHAHAVFPLYSSRNPPHSLYGYGTTPAPPSSRPPRNPSLPVFPSSLPHTPAQAVQKPPP